MGGESRRPPLHPFVVAGYLYLWLGLVTAVYLGLDWVNLVSRVGWIRWGHIHFVTVGGFTHLLFAVILNGTARRFGHDPPGQRSVWAILAALNLGFGLAWIGRSFDVIPAFDAGLGLVWLVALGILVQLLRWGTHSDRSWETTTVLFVAASFVLIWGLTFAFGLFGHLWEVPGGWVGLREAHIHANGWGFFGLAVIASLNEAWPRLVGTDLHSTRVQRYSTGLLLAGILPLVLGPFLGLRRSVTAPGLVLFVAGFGLFLYNLLRTTRAGEASGFSVWVLAAQFWLLGPAFGAPFVFFGVDWVSPTAIERTVLHFFFIGWALPIVLAALLLYAEHGGENIVDALSSPPALSPRFTLAWNAAVLVLGLGFLFQASAWATSAFALGTGVIVLVWAAILTRSLRRYRAMTVGGP